MNEMPTQIGPYRVTDRLGRGGMGVVFRAEDPKTLKPLAVKTVRLPSERHLAAIRREVRALAQIDHPGVVRIVDEGLQDGLPWYAMELLQGVTLRDRAVARPTPSPHPDWSEEDAMAPTGSGPALPQEYAPTLIGHAEPRPTSPEFDDDALKSLLTVFRGLCDPLGYVHGEGLVHCDLKPENIFLREDGRPVLVDFGLISRFGGAINREVLDLELFVGTAEYMAPEQWEGKPVDARTDLYALGCILYECITGQPPYYGPRKELYKEHLKAPIPKIQHLIPSVPKALDDLVQRLLAKTPAMRPGHADEVARALESLGAQAPTPGPSARPYLFRPALAGRGRATHELLQRITGPQSQGQLILLGGESGVGKTRLAMEAVRMAKRGGLRVLTGECVPNAKLLAPIRNLLAAVTDECRQAPDRLQALLGPHAKVLARLEPALAHLPGMEAEPNPEPLPAEAERMRLLEALVHTLAAFAKQGKIFWLLDDLHWADPMTLDFLEQLQLRSQQLAGVSILCTYRSEEVSAELQHLLDVDGAEKMDLGRLNGRAIARMVADMLGLEPPEGFVQFLTAQSEGNPFFVAEYLRTALGAELLTRNEAGRWTLTGASSAEQLNLPRSIAALLAHRLAHLGRDARWLADAACVLGRELDPDIAATVAQVSQERADRAFGELLRKQILEETSTGKLRFSHDKIREVAYDDLDGDVRTTLHRQSARELERSRTEGAQDVAAAVLAHHWIHAGQPAKAVVELDTAAEEALASGGYLQATGHLEQALKLSAPKADGHSVALAPMKRASWHQRLGETYLAEGRLDASRENAGTALDLLDVPRPLTRGAWVRTLLGQFIRQVGHRLLPQGVFVASEGQAALAEATRATAHMARIAFFENDPLVLIASSVWSINLAERAGSYMHAARNYSGLGWTFGIMRLHGVANAYFARARHVGEESRDWSGLIFCLTSEAVYRIGRAEFEATDEALQDCKVPCEMAQDPQGEELASTLSAHSPYFRGDFVQAMQIHEAVLKSATSRKNQQHAAWSLYCIGRARIALADYEGAQASLNEAAELLKGLTDQMSDITCTGLRAIAALRSGDIETAKTLAAETEAHIGTTMPTTFITLHGYEAVAEVALFEYAKNRDSDHAKRAKRAVRKLRQTAGLFVVGQARAHLLHGRLLRLKGDLRGARKRLETGRTWAERFKQPYEDACLVQELGRLFDDRAPERAVQNRLAGRAFEAMGCLRPEGAYLDTR